MRRPLVLEASVALKWYLGDEEHTGVAMDMLEAHASGKIALVAPALLEFELANAMAIALRRGRAAEADVLNVMESFISLDITLYSLGPRYQKVIGLSSKYTISAYDAAYVALAEDLKIQVVTADKRLYNSTNKLKLVKWIGDFKV